MRLSMPARSRTLRREPLPVLLHLLFKRLLPLLLVLYRFLVIAQEVDERRLAYFAR